MRVADADPHGPQVLLGDARLDARRGLVLLGGPQVVAADEVAGADRGCGVHGSREVGTAVSGGGETEV